jgi:hypothetical protein
VSKKNAIEIQQAVVHHKHGQTIQCLHRNDEKWPHTREIKIAGRNHILPPLGIEHKNQLTLT